MKYRSALSSDENWYVVLEFDDVEDYRITVEVQRQFVNMFTLDSLQQALCLSFSHDSIKFVYSFLVKLFVLKVLVEKGGWMRICDVHSGGSGTFIGGGSSRGYAKQRGGDTLIRCDENTDKT